LSGFSGSATQGVLRSNPLICAATCLKVMSLRLVLNGLFITKLGAYVTKVSSREETKPASLTCNRAKTGKNFDTEPILILSEAAEKSTCKWYQG
jgi:hypothetical protein